MCRPWRPGPSSRDPWRRAPLGRRRRQRHHVGRHVGPEARRGGDRRCSQVARCHGGRPDRGGLGCPHGVDLESGRGWQAANRGVAASRRDGPALVARWPAARRDLRRCRARARGRWASFRRRDGAGDTRLPLARRGRGPRRRATGWEPLTPCDRGETGLHASRCRDASAFGLARRRHAPRRRRRSATRGVARRWRGDRAASRPLPRGVGGEDERPRIFGGRSAGRGGRRRRRHRHLGCLDDRCRPGRTACTDRARRADSGRDVSHWGRARADDRRRRGRRRGHLRPRDLTRGGAIPPDRSASGRRGCGGWHDPHRRTGRRHPPVDSGARSHRAARRRTGCGARRAAGGRRCCGARARSTRPRSLGSGWLVAAATLCRRVARARGVLG